MISGGDPTQRVQSAGLTLLLLLRAYWVKGNDILRCRSNESISPQRGHDLNGVSQRAIDSEGLEGRGIKMSRSSHCSVGPLDLFPCFPSL